MGGVPNARGLHLHQNHLGPLTNGVTSLRYYSRVSFMPIVFWALLIERCAKLTPPNEVNALIHYIPSQHTNSQVAIVYGVARYLP